MSANKMTHPYTCTDILFQLLRSLVLASMINLANSILNGTTSLTSLAASVVLGSLLYYLLNIFFNWYMNYFFGFEALHFHDYAFLLQDEVNNHAIMGAGILEKFDYVNFKAYILEKAAKLHKCKAKLVKKFGVFWYQKMSEAEWKAAGNYVVQLGPTDVRSEQELKDFVCLE